MATSYDVGELVGYQSQICLISEMPPTQGGYNSYYLEDIDAERRYMAFEHQLVKASQLDLVILDGDVDMGSDDVGPAQLVPGQSGGEAVPVLTPTLVPAPTPATENPPSPQPSTSTDFATNALPTAHRGRFATLTTQDVDELASSRTSRNTNEQTKWGVKIFSGEWTGVILRYLLIGTTYISFCATIFSGCPALCQNAIFLLFTSAVPGNYALNDLRGWRVMLTRDRAFPKSVHDLVLNNIIMDPNMFLKQLQPMTGGC